MRSRLTFPEVTQVLLEYKSRTYPQNQLIRDLFSSCLKTSASNPDEAVEDNIKFSKWVNGERPIPQDILDTYKETDGYEDMKCDVEELIIPNLINVSGAREKLAGLIRDSIDVIGQEKADELISETDDATFITGAIRYAIYSNHDNITLLSPVLSETILSNRLPSVADGFVGRKREEKECGKKLSEQGILFIGGIAGIGKSEFAKYFADKNRKKYTNIIYIHYSGDLKKDITDMIFNSDRSDMTSDELFTAHYRILQGLYEDSLIILDNFNVLPKEEPFFKEFRSNRFHILVTTRCNLNLSDERKEELLTLDLEKELIPLFISNCPSAKNDKANVSEIIKTVYSHTLTVILSSLTLAECGMEAGDLLYELKKNGLNAPDAESVDIYKDGDYAEGLMIDHLRTLLSLNNLSEEELLIMRCMSLMPSTGVLKQHLKDWLQLETLDTVIRLVKHGLIQDDTENRLFSLHPLIRDVVISTLMPSVSNCRILLNSLHLVCLVHGLEYMRPTNAIRCQLSVMENIIIDDYPAYLLFLQNLFPHLEKYRYTDELPKLVDRIIMVMKEGKINTSCDSALLQDFKAQLYIEKKDYDNAIKKQNKAISIMEKCHKPDATKREMNL
ncbi:MAG: ATP-binding protein, partial [Eubacterium sp.]|nr:ATP-binding protein [Eubacterium sp.]